jgi:hypothetical protein
MVLRAQGYGKHKWTLLGKPLGKSPIEIWRRTMDDFEMEVKTIIYICGK